MCFKCNEEETQFHIFQACEPVLSKLGTQNIPAYEHIYGNISEQKSAVSVFTQIDHIRKQMTKDLMSWTNIHPTWRIRSQDPC